MSIEGAPEKEPSRLEKALLKAAEEAAATLPMPEEFNSPHKAEIYREEAQKSAKSYLEEWMRLLAAYLKEYSMLRQNFEREIRAWPPSFSQEEKDARLREYHQRIAAKQHAIRNRLKLVCAEKGVSESTTETLVEEFMREQIRAL